MDKARKNKNGNNCSQKQHDKVRDPNNWHNNTGVQHQLNNAYEQVFLEIYKCQQKAVLVDLGCRQIKGDDERPHIVAHKGECSKTNEKKSQYDIRKKPLGVVVKNQTVAKQTADQKIDNSDDQGLLPVCFYRIKKKCIFARL